MLKVSNDLLHALLMKDSKISTSYGFNLDVYVYEIVTVSKKREESIKPKFKLQNGEPNSRIR
jgi:hypothetical protein